MRSAACSAAASAGARCKEAGTTASRITAARSSASTPRRTRSAILPPCTCARSNCSRKSTHGCPANWTRSRSRRPCASSRRPGPNPKPDEGAQQEIAECDAKLRQHRAALEAGADPVLNHQLQVRRALAEARIKTPAARRRMTQEEITSFVTEVGGIMQALNEADPADKAEVYGRPAGTRQSRELGP